MAEYRSRKTIQAVEVGEGGMPFAEMNDWLLSAISDGVVVVKDGSVSIKPTGSRKSTKVSAGDFITFENDEIGIISSDEFRATYAPPTGWRIEEDRSKQFSFLKD